MTLSSFRLKGGAAHLQPPMIGFLCEQDGRVEQRLKGKLTRLFRARQEPQRAYLARIHFGNPRENSVALCLRTPSGEDPALVAEIGLLFAGIFRHDIPLDILFISEEQERDLARVCPPFYDTAAPPPELVRPAFPEPHRWQVVEVATFLFGETRRAAAITLLDEYEPKKPEKDPGRARVQMACLLLSEGNFIKLNTAVATAKQDYRTVLMMSEHTPQGLAQRQAVEERMRSAIAGKPAVAG